MDQVPGLLRQVFVELVHLDGLLYGLFHPRQVLAVLLDESVGLVLKIWFKFILSTTDFETGGDFVNAITVQRFEPKVQLAANGALVLIAMWASFRIMWGHGLFTQYTARIMLPRLFMAVVLINFALPLFQVVVDASNTVSGVVQSMVRLDDPSTWLASIRADSNAGAWEMLTTAGLALGYDTLAIAYLVRYAILIVLAITAPIAGLLFMLPETHHVSKMWTSHFVTNVFMQPAQLFVLAIGFALERDGATPIHHLFALAILLIVFKVPGAMGGAEKAAHRLESTVSSVFKHTVHALARA